VVKTLTRTGNSLAIVLDKPLLDQTGIDANTQLEVSTNGDVIVLSPVRDKHRQARFKAAAEKVFTRYAGVFARLAREDR